MSKYKLDDFFSSIKVGPRIQIPKKSERSIEQDIDKLEEIFNRADGDPVMLVDGIFNLIDMMGKTYEYSAPSINFSAVSSTYREKNYLKGRYTSIDKYAESPNIYNNVYPYQFRDQLEQGELMLFTYLIDSAGLHLGLYENMFEFGTGHSFLMGMGSSRYDETKYYIIAAGEILLQDNQLLFNFESGTFMRNSKVNDFPRYKDFLINSVGSILGLVPMGISPFSSVLFTEKAIFPALDFPLVSTLQKQLRTDPQSMVMVNTGDEKYDIRSDLYFEDIAGAQRYFSRHPYQQVMLRQDGNVYTNPYKERPTEFINIEEMYTGMRRSVRRSARKNKRSVRRSARKNKRSVRRSKRKY